MADRLDDLDHRVGIETIKLPFSVPADLEHATNGIGCPWPACCDDAELGPYLGANLIELRDLIRSDVGVVHDHGRRLQTAQVVRDLRAVLIDQEERISLQRERPHEKRLPGPRLADKQAITFVLFQPAHLPFAAKHCISQQRSLGDGKQAQRCGPPRNPQEPPAPFGLSIETLRKPVLIVGLPERHAAGASCFEEPAPTDAGDSPRRGKQRAGETPSEACPIEIARQIVDEPCAGGDDQRKRLACPTGDRAIEAVVPSSANWDQLRPLLAEQSLGALFKYLRVQPVG